MIQYFPKFSRVTISNELFSDQIAKLTISCLLGLKAEWERWSEKKDEQTDTKLSSETDTQYPLKRKKQINKYMAKKTHRENYWDRHTDKQLTDRDKKKTNNRFPIISYASNIVLLSTIMANVLWLNNSSGSHSTLKLSVDGKHPSASMEWRGEDAGLDPSSIYTTIQSLPLLFECLLQYEPNIMKKQVLSSHKMQITQL